MSKQQNSESTDKCTRPYVYYSYEEWGRGYIGCRTARGCEPGDDYLGSFRDPTFDPVDKIILFEGTVEECLEVEVKLHDFFDVARNPHFANRARQTSTGFCRTGAKDSEETRQRKREAHLGITHTDEAKEKMSRNRRGKGREPRSPESNLKRSLTQKGRPKSEEWKEKIRQGNIGKHDNRTDEWRRKQSEAQKEAWKRKRGEIE